jgi:hypothetical protein
MTTLSRSIRFATIKPSNTIQNPPKHMKSTPHPTSVFPYFRFPIRSMAWSCAVACETKPSAVVTRLRTVIVCGLVGLILPVVRAQSVTTVTVDDGTFGVTGLATSQAIVAGNPAIAYFEETHGRLMFARNNAVDGSGAWSLQMIDANLAGNYGTYVSTSLKVIAGNPAVCYLAGAELRYARCSTSDGSGTWTVKTVQSFAVGGDCSLAEVNGAPCISCGIGDFLIFLRSQTATGLGAWSFVTVDPNSNSGYDTSLNVVDGKPAIAYRDLVYGQTGDEGKLRYARCTTADGLGAWTLAIVDPTPGTGEYASLAVVDGKPAISYHDGAAGDLKFARNASADGSGAWTTATLDAAGDTGEHTSLAVVGGKPAISYLYASSNNPRYARCPNADGSGAWTIGTVESGGFALGLFTSLVAADGKPSISYYDASNGNLRHARNSAADGSGTWTYTVVDSADDVGSVGSNPSLAVVAGKPSAFYFDMLRNRVAFAQSATADGLGPWSSNITTMGTSVYDFCLADIGGKPAGSFSDYINGDLKSDILAAKSKYPLVQRASSRFTISW